jgi:hypothetical protein
MACHARRTSGGRGTTRRADDAAATDPRTGCGTDTDPITQAQLPDLGARFIDCPHGDPLPYDSVEAPSPSLQPTMSALGDRL